MKIDRTSTLILFDEYIIPTRHKYVEYRRPTFFEMSDALQNRKGILCDISSHFANELKTLFIFAPTAYVDPYWLFNNPKLLHLSTLEDTPETNIIPLFQEDFFKVYWGRERKRKKYKFKELLEGLYPERNKPFFQRNASWIDGIYHNVSREQFNNNIRYSLKNYVDYYLKEMDNVKTSASLSDPAELMTPYINELYKDPSHHQFYQLTKDIEIQKLILETLSYFINGKVRFSCSEAFPLWRRIAKEKGYKSALKLGPAIDWLFIESIYLRGHADLINGIPAGFNERSTYIGSLNNVSGNFIVQAKTRSLNLLNRIWPIIPSETQGLNYLPDLLSTLPFDVISSKIRKEKFYDNYRENLRTINGMQDEEKQTNRYIKEIEILLGYVAPILAENVKDEHARKIFKRKGILKIITWIVEHSGTLCAAAGTASTATQHFGKDLPPCFRIPLAILGFGAAGGFGLIGKLGISDRTSRTHGRTILSLAKHENQ